MRSKYQVVLTPPNIVPLLAQSLWIYHQFITSHFSISFWLEIWFLSGHQMRIFHDGEPCNFHSICHWCSTRFRLVSYLIPHIQMISHAQLFILLLTYLLIILHYLTSSRQIDHDSNDKKLGLWYGWFLLTSHVVWRVIFHLWPHRNKHPFPYDLFIETTFYCKLDLLWGMQLQNIFVSVSLKQLNLIIYSFIWKSIFSIKGWGLTSYMSQLFPVIDRF